MGPSPISGPICVQFRPFIQGSKFYQLLPIDSFGVLNPIQTKCLFENTLFFFLLLLSRLLKEKKQQKNYRLFIHLLKQLIKQKKKKKRNEASNGYLNLDIIAAQRLIGLN